MPNEKNVAALLALLREVMDEQLGGGYNYGPGAEEIARFLASRGVLVPSALTDEEIELEVWLCRHYEAGEDNQDFAKPDPAGMRAALERIAKGES